MLTRILHNSQELCTFVEQLHLTLSAPQHRHVINVADGLLVAEGHKTLAEIQRQLVTCVDPSNIATPSALRRGRQTTSAGLWPRC